MNHMTFSALAEPNRLHIVELLRDKPRPVNEIVVKLHLNQPQASKHLKVLADAGIVEAKPVAQKRYYQLRAEPLQELDRWITTYRTLWDERYERLDELLIKERKRSKKNIGIHLKKERG